VLLESQQPLTQNAQSFGHIRLKFHQGLSEAFAGNKAAALARLEKKVHVRVHTPAREYDCSS
jgi:hypothetical protein